MIYERKNIKDWKALVKEGNIIKIRQWDDMESEYGLIGIDSINCECAFTDDMRNLCGSEIKINEKMVEDFKKYKYFFADSKTYSISTDMIEYIKTTDDIVIDKITFISDDKKEEIIKRLEKTLYFDREFYDKMKTIPLVFFTETVQNELQEDCVTYMLIETVKKL